LADHSNKRPEKHKIIGNFIFMSALILLMLTAVWVRAFVGSMNDFNKGEELLAEKQYVKAITFFDRAMHWYAFFNPYVEKSAEYLWEISDNAEKINDHKLAIIALETIRNSFYGTRSFCDPGLEWINECDKRILEIVGNSDESKPVSDNLTGNDKNAYLIKTKYNDPEIFWTIVLETGFLGWVGSVIGLICFCPGRNNRQHKLIYSCWFWISLAFITYGLWLLGIFRA